MHRRTKENLVLFLFSVGLLGWLIPGAGYFLLKEKKRALIVFVTITLTFAIGIYVGSIGVIDYVRSWPWFIGQIMNSPMVIMLGKLTAGGSYRVYGKPAEIGQIYTAISGLLNLLCIVNAVYLAYVGEVETAEIKK
ncbi:MAG: hypothetical protein KAS69_04280 [Planctomycetes bacterium]|nr:hypothetical protein [Planctomycetota bacterium]